MVAFAVIATIMPGFIGVVVDGLAGFGAATFSIILVIATMGGFILAEIKENRVGR